MQTETLLGLVNNAALLLALGLLYDILPQRRHLERPGLAFLQGLVLAGIGLAVMLNPWTFVPGIVFDTRSILLCLAGLYFGNLPTAVAVIATVVFRIYQGGAGLGMGVAVIMSSAALGLGFRRLRRDRLATLRRGELYLFGLVVHLDMLLCGYLFLGDSAVTVLRQISLPVMLIYPLGTLLLGQLLSQRLARQTAEAELREREQHLRHLFESLPVCIDALDDQDRIIAWNAECERVTGYGADEMLTNPRAFELLYPDPEQRARMLAEIAQEGMSFHDREWTLTAKSGEQRTISWTNISSQAPIEGWHTWAVGVDVTERHQAEEAVRASEARYRAVLDAASDGVWLLGSDHRALFANRALAGMFGYELLELLGELPLSLVDESERVTWQDYLDGLGGGEVAPLELRFRHKRGRDVWTIVHASPLLDEAGHYDGSVIMVTDVTDLRRRETLMRISEERYRHLYDRTQQYLDVAASIILALDVQGRITLLNESGAQVLACQADEITGLNWFDTFAREQTREHSRKLYAQMMAGELEPKEYAEAPLVTLAGELRIIRWRDILLRDEQGRITGMLSSGEDVTEQRATEEALAHAYEIVSASPAIVFRWTAEKGWPIEFVSSNVTGLLGYGVDDLVSGQFAYVDLIHPMDLLRVESEVDCAQYDPTRVDYVSTPYRLIDKSGAVHWVDERSHIVRDSNGRATHYQGVVIDVTEREEAASQAHLGQQIIEQLPEAIILTDMQGCILRWEGAAEQVFGYGAQEIIGQPVSVLHAPEVRAQATAEIIAGQEAGRVYRGEIACVTKEGREISVEVVSRMVRNAQGEPIGMVGINTDISERKAAAKALRTSESELRRLFNEAPVGIFRTNSDGRVIRVNQELARMVGCESPEQTLALFQDLGHQLYVHPERRQEFVRLMRQEGQVQAFEYTARRRDGSEAVFSMDATIAERMGDGRFSMDGFTRDVTASRVAEEALRASERRFRRAIGEAPFPIMLHADDGEVLSLSRAWTELTGYAREELTTTADWSIKAFGERSAEVLGVIDHTYELTGALGEGEWPITCADGSELIWDFYSTPLGPLPDGRHLVVTMASDVTERLKAARALRAANEELEARVEQRTAELASRNRELETFTYSVSHDLKAPLRGIDGYSHLLLRDYIDQLDEDGRFFLTTIRQATQQMSQLIEDLLAYSRLERRPVHQNTASLRDLVENALRECEADLAQTDIDVRVDLDCPPVVVDPDGMGIAIRNLLDNAIKFTAPSQNPTISIGGREGITTCTMWVRDSGVGFDMRFHDRIFEVFQRLHRAEDYPGTGVGLAIVKRAMERMGGRVWAESEPGQGATFYLEVPKAP